MDYRAELEKMQEQYGKEIETIRGTLTSSGSADLSAAMMLQARLSDKENQLYILKKELRDNRVFMSKVHSRETALAGPPVLPKKASKPNLKLNLVVAAIAGFLVMFSFILLSEQYRKGSIRF